MRMLDQSVTAKNSEVLSKSITEARVGRGRGGRCALCHVAIRHAEAEVKVEVESRRGVFQQVCFNLWREEVALLRVMIPE